MKPGKHARRYGIVYELVPVICAVVGLFVGVLIATIMFAMMV